MPRNQPAAAGVILIGLLATLFVPAAIAMDGTEARVSVLDVRLPSARWGAGAVWTGDAALVYAGVDVPGDGNPVSFRDVVRVDPEAGQVERLEARLPGGRDGVAAVWTGNATLLFGGRNPFGEDYAQVLRHEPGTGRIEVMNATLPTPRWGASAVWTGTHALVFGGTDGTRQLDEVVRFDPATGGLDVAEARIPSGRHDTSAVWTGERALVFGGYHGGPPIAEVVTYDASNDRFGHLHAELPSPRGGTSAVWNGSAALVFGGFRTHEVVAVHPGAADEGASRLVPAPAPWACAGAVVAWAVSSGSRRSGCRRRSRRPPR